MTYIFNVKMHESKCDFKTKFQALCRLNQVDTTDIIYTAVSFKQIEHTTRYITIKFHKDFFKHDISVLHTLKKLKNIHVLQILHHVFISKI